MKTTLVCVNQFADISLEIFQVDSMPITAYYNLMNNDMWTKKSSVGHWNNEWSSHYEIEMQTRNHLLLLQLQLLA